MKVASLLFLTFFCAMPLRANVVVCPAAHDTALDESDPNNSDGGGPAFFAGTDGDSAPHRALISFDLSGIPPGATITNVQLTLTLALVAGGGGGGGGSEPTSATIGLYDLTRNWGEGTSESNATGVQGTGHGAPASPGDATWDAAFYEETLWTNPGGDHLTTASGSLFLNGNTTGTAFIWPSTAQMVADVQGWLNNPSTNYGWELINADETDPRTLYGFYSREWSMFPGGQASQEPALQVTYTPASGVPVPVWAGWAALAAVTGVGWSALRRPCGSSKQAAAESPQV